MSTDGREVILDQGGVITSTEDSPNKPPGKRRNVSNKTATQTVPPTSTPTTVTVTLVPSDTVQSDQGQ